MEKKHWLALGGAGAVFILVAFLVGAQFAIADQVTEFPRPFFIGGVDVGGISYEKARVKVGKAAADLTHKGIVMALSGESGVYHIPLVVKNEPLFIIDVNETMKNARAVAERGTVARALASIAALVGSVETERIDLVVTDTPRTRVLLDEELKTLQLPFQKPKNAYFNWTKYGSIDDPFEGSVDGLSISPDSVSDAIILAVSKGNTDIKISPQLQHAEISGEDADPLEGAAIGLFAPETHENNFFLTIEKNKISVARSSVAMAIQPVKTGSGRIELGIDPEILKKEVGAALAPFEKQGSSAVFERTGNRVTKFVPDVKGVAVDWTGTAADLFVVLSENKTNVVAVRTIETDPEVTLSSLNDLGIKEVIGFGTSEAKGSTSNRLHNITTGMSKINGTLIAPGETFSLIGALGPIDGTAGFTKELVIKDNKTTPEFGGGLCQIGTTTFRAAMGAGFPIVERRNHSYQVSYYFENGVSGTDATIYDPKPDFRFMNDTGNWVMLQTQISGVKLTFTFWGTRDGRTATRTIPKISNLVSPPPKQTIETTDLPVGKVKCTEKAHTGASAVFTYSVTYPDGTVKAQDFKSVYKPWGEVCMIGVAATSTPSGVSTGSGALPGVASPDVAGVTGN